MDAWKGRDCLDAVPNESDINMNVNCVLLVPYDLLKRIYQLLQIITLLSYYYMTIIILAMTSYLSLPE